MTKLRRTLRRRLRHESLETRLLLTSAGDACPPSISQQGDLVVAVGSADNDTVELELGLQQHRLDFSGFEYTFDASVVREIRIGGGAGTNTIRIVGSGLEDNGSAIGATGRLTSASYTALSFSFQSTTLDGGGGNDYAQVYGSDAADNLQGLPDSTVLVTPDNTLTATSFDRVDAYGRGGYDYAQVYGTDQSDHFGATDEYTLLTGPGISKYTKGFERVDAFGRGGNDRAQLLDSSRNDSVVVGDDFAYLNNGIRLSYTRGFENVEVSSVSGGVDTALFLAVSGADQVSAAPNTVALAQSTFTIQLDNMDVVSEQDGNGTVVNDQWAEFSTMLAALAPFVSNATLDAIADRMNQTRSAINGTNNAEELLGQNSDNQIRALDGNDVVFALAGEDALFGGGGNDSLEGMDDDDIAFGGTGNDELKGGNGNDVLLGGVGNDIIDGEFGTDYVSSGSGNDLFRFVSGDGTIFITDFDRNRDRIELINIDPNDISTGSQSGSLTINHPDGLNIVLIGISPALGVNDLSVTYPTTATQTLFDPNA